MPDNPISAAQPGPEAEPDGIQFWQTRGESADEASFPQGSQAGQLGQAQRRKRLGPAMSSTKPLPVPSQPASRCRPQPRRPQAQPACSRQSPRTSYCEGIRSDFAAISAHACRRRSSAVSHALPPVFRPLVKASVARHGKLDHLAARHASQPRFTTVPVRRKDKKATSPMKPTPTASAASPASPSASANSTARMPPARRRFRLFDPDSRRDRLVLRCDSLRVDAGITRSSATPIDYRANVDRQSREQKLGG